MNRILLPLIFFVLLPLSGENIMGNMAGILQVEDSEYTSPVSLPLEEIVSLNYLYDNPFVQGLELTFQIPETTKRYRNSFALYLFRSITPKPEMSTSSYRGSHFYMQILPFTSEFSVKIPFDEANGIRKDADSVVTSVASRESFPLLMTLLPIAKGLSSGAQSAEITVMARPIYKDEGGLVILIEDNHNLIENNTVILIDDVEVSWPQEYYSLKPGLHRVHIQNELSGSRDFNVAIEQGQFTEIQYALEESTPRVTFQQTRGVQFFLDGSAMVLDDLGKPISIEPGTHQITVKVNNELSITREYTFVAGENLTISLETQLLIEKD